MNPQSPFPVASGRAVSDCPGRGHGHRSARLRRARVAVVITVTAGLALLAAACGSGSGGSPSAGAAAAPSSAVSSSPAVRSGSGGSTQAGGLLAYSSCMRSHGVPNFPDPDSSGTIPKQAVISANSSVSNSQLQAASNACKSLLPPGGSLSGQPSQTITAQDQQDYLRAAACMRSHGITNFPDPVFRGGQVEFPQLQHLVDINSPQFMQAYGICKKLIPPGLPDSGSGG